ncbi:Similar to Lima1: LIM domain and actin-binding protein 1 (Rattus norvegicus) [Cotesia congregata]|uniref:Similar to Lima1: LIM domain and actin-binding protein 1 (Rattus norvegicus) n=1 Tax=Cotesia congregata TaxID=51543 RepID=A0A8J2HPV8_COTCN|nr:Similar to Lima1: LIM domain and actin-binding protein 1 (Rattus norvegicus) [Cotesia congregata]
MAELVENKTTSLVSTKQNDIACGANSNIALINIDKITASSEELGDNDNNIEEKGINGCIIINNVEESSLRSIIDNELALIRLKNELEQENKKMLIDEEQEQLTNHHHQLELSSQLCQDLVGINNSRLIIETDIEESNGNFSQNFLNNSGEIHERALGSNSKLVDHQSYQDNNNDVAAATAATCDAAGTDLDPEPTALNTLIDFLEDRGKKSELLAEDLKNAEESLPEHSVIKKSCMKKNVSEFVVNESENGFSVDFPSLDLYSSGWQDSARFIFNEQLSATNNNKDIIKKKTEEIINKNIDGDSSVKDSSNIEDDILTETCLSRQDPIESTIIKNNCYEDLLIEFGSSCNSRETGSSLYRENSNEESLTGCSRQQKQQVKNSLLLTELNHFNAIDSPEPGEDEDEELVTTEPDSKIMSDINLTGSKDIVLPDSDNCQSDHSELTIVSDSPKKTNDLIINNDNINNNNNVNTDELTNNLGVCESMSIFSLLDPPPVCRKIFDDNLTNACSTESSEEVITTSTITSTTTKSSAKIKKKKIEGVIGNSDVTSQSPPQSSISATRTKKTKKSKKKSDLEKENISVNINTGDSSMHNNNSHHNYRNSVSAEECILDQDDFSNVNVKTLTQCYTLESTKCKELTKFNKETIETGVSIKQLAGQNGGCDANPNCRSCGKVVFQMEQTKAEGLIWHKNCFRCIQCSKQLNVDNYESHECTLYCKPHFKELFQPKPVDDSNRSLCPQKPEMIIRENHPKELPPDVVRASDKPDLGLEELSSLNVKSRFQVFEKSSTNEQMNDIEKSASQISVKRSPSILSKLAKFQAKGMDIGVADESLNGIPYEESSESEEEEENEEDEEGDADIVKSKKSIRERPISFTKMDDMKNRWEVTSQQGRRESQREARKEEIAGIRSRLFMGKQGKMKELYQQAVATSERVTKINPAEEFQCTPAHARSIKEKFERGEPITSSNEDEADSNSTSNKIKQEKPDEDVIAAGISRKSRSLFLELDASAAKSGRPMTPAAAPANSKSLTDAPRRARDVRADDVVRSTDTTEEIQVETSDISNKFKFFETYKEPEKERKQFRITPPRDGQVKVNSPEREIYRDPDVIRADDKVDQLVHTDTTKKMLSIFRQMEEKATKEDVPDGPKPLKRFTPPPEDKYAKLTASDTDEEEDGEEEEEDGNEDITEEERRNPNYVRASDKNAQNAANAKTLRAKFEQWEVNDKKINNHSTTIVDEMELIKATNGDGEQTSIESTRSLKARFESLGTQQVTESPRAPKVKVNRFVGIPTTVDIDICESCQKKVYPLEKIETNNKIFHKQCFRCLQCNCILRMDSFTLNNGKLYCIPHFKQLFIVRGNYEEGFGIDQHKNKWISNGALDISPQNTTSSPIIIDS